MTKLFEPFDWKKINDKEYCRQYEQTREVNRGKCKEEIEAKYDRLYKRYLTTFERVNYNFLSSEIRKTCAKYGFEDAVMDPKTFEIEVF